MQDANTGNMIYNVQDQIAYLSTMVSLCPGEVIATGLSTGLAYADAGDTAVADFGDLGQVTVAFTDT